MLNLKFKIQVQDSFLEYFFWRFKKQITLSEKKPPLGKSMKISPEIWKIRQLLAHLWQELV